MPDSPSCTGNELTMTGSRSAVSTRRTASHVAPGGRRATEVVFEHLRRELVDLFPAIRDAEITHRWGGLYGVQRNGWAGVGLDSATGIAWAGGLCGLRRRRKQPRRANADGSHPRTDE
jgi:glycine/D-amino acid oxidase-like deaminating enzyme